MTEPPLLTRHRQPVEPSYDSSETGTYDQLDNQINKQKISERDKQSDPNNIRKRKEPFESDFGKTEKPIEYDRRPETISKTKSMAQPGYKIRVTPSKAMKSFQNDDSESTLEKMIPDHHDLGNVRFVFNYSYLRIALFELHNL